MTALIAGLVSTALIASAAFVLVIRGESEHTVVYVTMLLSFLGVIVNQLVTLKVGHDTRKVIDDVKTTIDSTPPSGLPEQ